MNPHLPSAAQLLALGLAAGALWRIEVEFHGWEGLLWLSYPHLAVPARRSSMRSDLLAVLAGPAAVAARTALEPNHADGMHAVKTGAAVPFAVWALGVPWVFRPPPVRPTTRG